MLACHVAGNLRRRLGRRAIARVHGNGRLAGIARPDHDQTGALLHLAGNVTLAAPQPRPPGTRVTQQNRDTPLFGHARDATPTPATTKYGAVASYHDQ